MIKRATLSVVVMLLLTCLIGLNMPEAKAQSATPSEAVITVNGVPAATKGLAVEVTVDTSIVKLGSGSSDVSGALVVVGSNSEGVGVISTSGDLPSTFMITVPLTGVAEGSSMLSVGMVLDMIGGTEITGATAAVDVSSVSVGAAPPPTPTPAPPSGMGGNLSADTITISINGEKVGQTNALNVTVAFTDTAVATLASGVTFMGAGATQLLTDVNTSTGVVSVVWDGTITDNAATVTAMLAAGTKAGTANISVIKVEAAGGEDITANVVATVTPSSVTNSTPGETTDLGSFELIGPDSVTGPGKAAVAFSVSGLASGATATLNSAMVEFVDSNMVGIAIVDIAASGSVPLMLAVTASGMTSDVDLGSVSVTGATRGKPPKVNSARAQNRSSSSTLKILGQKFFKSGTSIEIVPTDRAPSKDPKIAGKVIKATFSADECIPSGSYVNVTTPGGIGSKKIKVRGMCDNSLVE